MNRQQFRYLACGGFMAVLDLCTFWVVYNIILHRQPVHFGSYALDASLAAIWLPFPIGFLISYLLSRYVVFHETQLKSTTSLFRYVLLVVACFILNSVLIHLFIDTLLWNAIFSKILCTILIAGFSYVVQKFFAFKHTPVVQQ